MRAPVLPNEAERLMALRRYDILDTPPEQAFDDLALLAAQICHAPYAQISFVDADRQWFKATVGTVVTQTPRDVAFCAHTVNHRGPIMEIPDALLDERFSTNPFVTGAPQIRFYAGAPLVTPEGYALGALCVIDVAPRQLTAGQHESLKALGRQVTVHLELRRHAREMAAEVASRQEAQRQLTAQNEQLLTSQREAARLLELAQDSRRALLNVLEDERFSSVNLRESEERFRQVVENIREVFWLTEVEEDRFIYISPGYEAIWGRRREDLYASAQTWADCIQPEDRDRVLQTAGNRKSGEYDVTFRIIRPDHEVRWIRAQSFPVRAPDGRVRRVVGVAEDVTERKKLENQFLHAQRMDAIGSLASGVAHDLNNILAPMLMVAGLLKDKLTSPKDRSMLRMMETSGQRGAGIIQQLLTFSRGVSGERVTLQLKHLVRDMGHIMRETFPRNLKIVEAIPPDLATVEADLTQMHQVLMNLCVNARDAMPNGGTLRIAAANATVTAATTVQLGVPPGRYVTLAVSDTGTGIPPEIIDRIFEPFFTTKEVGKGTGLGLSTALGIVETHGGHLRVTSEAGKGTTFTAYVPANADPEPTPATQTTATPMPRGNGELVLVVDDEEALRVMTRSFLERHGYRVLIAGDGQEALKLFLQFQSAIRLVLTDIMMPGMDGTALLRAISTLKPSAKLIATSGLDQAANREDFAKIGVAEFLPKPCPPDRILGTLHAVLSEPTPSPSEVTTPDEAR